MDIFFPYGFFRILRRHGDPVKPLGYGNICPLPPSQRLCNQKKQSKSGGNLAHLAMLIQMLR